MCLLAKEKQTKVCKYEVLIYCVKLKGKLECTVMNAR